MLQIVKISKIIPEKLAIKKQRGIKNRANGYIQGRQKDLLIEEGMVGGISSFFGRYFFIHEFCWKLTVLTFTEMISDSV